MSFASLADRVEALEGRLTHIEDWASSLSIPENASFETQANIERRKSQLATRLAALRARDVK